MENENKEINNQPAPAEQEEIKSEASQTNDQEVQEEQIDYKAELEKLKSENQKKDTQIKQAEYNIEQLKKEKKEQDDWNFEDDEKKEDVKSILKEELGSFKKELLSDSIDNMIATMTSNQDEQALIRHHYENSIKQTGLDKQSILNDIQSAYALANSKSILKQNREYAEALKAKQTLGSGAAGSSAGPGVKSSGYPDDLSETDISFLKSQGITPEKYNKLRNK